MLSPKVRLDKGLLEAKRKFSKLLKNGLILSTLHWAGQQTAVALAESTGPPSRGLDWGPNIDPRNGTATPVPKVRTTSIKVKLPKKIGKGV